MNARVLARCCAVVGLIWPLGQAARAADAVIASIPMPVHYAGFARYAPNATSFSAIAFNAATWNQLIPSGKSLYFRMCASYSDGGSVNPSNPSQTSSVGLAVRDLNLDYFIQADFEVTASSVGMSYQRCYGGSNNGAVNGWWPISTLSCKVTYASPGSCQIAVYYSPWTTGLGNTVPIVINSAWLEVVAR